MSNGTKSGRAQSIIQVIGALAAVIAAVVSLSAYVFSSPTDLNNMWKRNRHGYSVNITGANDQRDARAESRYRWDREAVR